MSGALPPAVVFGTSACPYCKRAKAALHEATGRRTVPQIYIKGNYVGGSDDLAAKLEAGELEALLSGAEGELPLTLRAAALVAVQEANNPRPAHDSAKLEPLAEALRDGKALP